MSHHNTHPFDFLPLPDSFATVLDTHNRLPLEYLPSHWLLIVCRNPKAGEYGFVTGRFLHRHWESSANHHFSGLSKSIPPEAVQVVCPNGTVLAVKITSYNEPSSSCMPQLPRDSADTKRRAAKK